MYQRDEELRAERARQRNPPITSVTNDLVKAVDDFKSTGQMPNKFELPPHILKKIERDELALKAENKEFYSETRARIAEKYRDIIRPDVYMPFLRNQMKTTLALKIVREWLRSDWQFLILAGEAGSGKTIAALDAMCFMDGDHIDVFELSQRLNPWGNEDDSFERIPLNRSLLILDDLGSEPRSERFLSDLHKFISKRQGSNSKGPLRTIITTNLDPNKLKKMYGVRIESRLQGITFFGITDEKDLRGK